MSACGHFCRYEELKKQLAEAQEAAQLEDEEAELARAESMLARLTSPALAAASRMAGREALTSPGMAGEGYGSSNSSVVRCQLLRPMTSVVVLASQVAGCAGFTLGTLGGAHIMHGRPLSAQRSPAGQVVADWDLACPLPCRLPWSVLAACAAMLACHA